MSKEMPLVIRAQNFKALRSFEWTVSGVSALVGPNGAGKSTALSLIEMLRWSLENGADAGLGLFGNGPLKHFDAPDHEDTRVSIGLGDVTWGLSIRGNEVVQEETLEGVTSGFAHSRQNRDPFWHLRSAQGTIVGLPRGAGLALNSIAALSPEYAPGLKTLRQTVLASRVFRMPDIRTLKESGSPSSTDVAVDARANNLFTVLRNWRDRSEHEHRFTFVSERMAELFPQEFRRLDFEQLAQRTSALAVPPNRKSKLLPTDWSDGFFFMLARLASVASVDGPALVAIDEPESALHPKLIVELLEILREWSRDHGTPVVLATHSPVLLDCFRDEPERVFVITASSERQPAALDNLKKREWLQHFSLGDLYSHLEVGAPTP